MTMIRCDAQVTDDVPSEAPKRQVKGGEEEAVAGDDAALVNLTSAIAGHLKAMGDANWKERQAGITAVEEIIVKAKPLGCTGVYMEASCGDLWPALKARLKDSNKNLATQTLSLLSKLAIACGPAIEKYAKVVLPNMLALISDNKKAVRDAVLACLSVWAERISAETVVKHLPIAITVDAPAGREDAVKWGAEYLSKVDSAKAQNLDLAPVLVPVMECLEHRVAEVRAGAEKCLIAIVACSGPALMQKLMRDMKPAQVRRVWRHAMKQHINVHAAYDALPCVLTLFSWALFAAEDHQAVLRQGRKARHVILCGALSTGGSRFCGICSHGGGIH
jgi:hypothetical protein